MGSLVWHRLRTTPLDPSTSRLKGVVGPGELLTSAAAFARPCLDGTNGRQPDQNDGRLAMRPLLL